jgi:hypothetical protein
VEKPVAGRSVWRRRIRTRETSEARERNPLLASQPVSLFNSSHLPDQRGTWNLERGTRWSSTSAQPPQKREPGKQPKRTKDQKGSGGDESEGRGPATERTQVGQTEGISVGGSQLLKEFEREVGEKGVKKSEERGEKGR